MQQNPVASSQLKNDSLEVPVGALPKSNLCVVVHLDDATNLLLLAHQLSRQCKLGILGRPQSKTATPLKDLPTPHRDRSLVRVGCEKAFESGEHGEAA